MSWTDERVDTLKRLWGEGLSASQIATQLGGVSRNAVIGKVHRLGLEGRVKKDGAGEDGQADGPVEAATADTAMDAAVDAGSDEAPAPAAATNGGTSDEGAGDDGASDAPDAPPFTAANDPGTPEAAQAGDGEEGDDVVVPVPLRLKLTQLTERTCKWPIGDPMHDDFHFCGHEADEGRPYCEYHSGLAFQPASERRRVR